jgi:hypothetical protein
LAAERALVAAVRKFSFGSAKQTSPVAKC